MPDDAALIDLLAALAYGELSAFDRLAEDARMAPSLSGRAALAQMAAVEIGHYRLLAERLIALGASPEEAMAPFAPALERFHARTVPADWLEGLVKAYVGDGLAADFYREIADFVDPATRELILEVLADAGSAAFAVREGDRVERGVQLGSIGATGLVTGPSLHWALYVNGLPVNPLPWLTPRPGLTAP